MTVSKRTFDSKHNATEANIVNDKNSLRKRVKPLRRTTEKACLNYLNGLLELPEYSPQTFH